MLLFNQILLDFVFIILLMINNSFYFNILVFLLLFNNSRSILKDINKVFDLFLLYISLKEKNIEF